MRSDIFGIKFKFTGFTFEFSTYLLDQLQEGIEESTAVDMIASKSPSDKNKIIELIDFLTKKGLLIKRRQIATLLPQDTLYDRQIRFFDSFESDVLEGTDFNKKLQNRKVVIVGLGAYGSWLALHCARLGIKQIVGVDFDVVELSNLPRQVLYTKNDIGLKKTEACEKMLAASDSEVKYEGHCKNIKTAEDLIPILDKADLIFNAFGYYPEQEAKNMIPGIITKASVLTKTPMLCLSANWLGPLYIPNISACYFCAVTKPELEQVLIKNKRNPRVDKRAFCPIFSLTCSLAVLEAVRYLSGINQPSIIDRLVSINPFHIQKSNMISIERQQNCKYCQ